MRLTDLIEKLSLLKEEHGNIKVAICRDDVTEWLCFVEVRGLGKQFFVELS